MHKRGYPHRHGNPFHPQISIRILEIPLDAFLETAAEYIYGNPILTKP